MSHKADLDTQKMRKDAGDLREQAQVFKNLSDDLFGEGRALDKLWEGDASDSFASRLQADEPRFGELSQIVGQYATAVDESAGEYDKTEAAVAEEMRSNTKRQSK